jgi:hypothetical protein
LSRLIDVEQLRRNLSPGNSEKSVTGRPQVGPIAGPIRPVKNEANHCEMAGWRLKPSGMTGNAHPDQENLTVVPGSKP